MTELRQRDPIGAAIMRERAAEMMDAVGHPTPAQSPVHMARQFATVLRALPLPTPAETLAYALELPEIKALMDAAKDVYDEYYSPGHTGPDIQAMYHLDTALVALEPKP